MEEGVDGFAGNSFDDSAKVGLCVLKSSDMHPDSLVNQLSLVLENHQQFLSNKLEEWYLRQDARLEELAMLLKDSQGNLQADLVPPCRAASQASVLNTAAKQRRDQMKFTTSPFQSKDFLEATSASTTKTGQRGPICTLPTVTIEEASCGISDSQNSPCSPYSSTSSPWTTTQTAMTSATIKSSLFQPGANIRSSRKTLHASDRGQDAAVAFLIGNKFECFCAVVMCLHILIIGLETEYMAVTNDSSPVYLASSGDRFGTLWWFSAVIHICNLWFLVELILRQLTAGWKMNKYWNSVDLLFVILWLMDVVAEGIGPKDSRVGSRMFRILRILRVFRTLRLFRFLRMLKFMRRMFVSMAGGMKTLMFSSIVVLFEIYFFSVFFTQATVNYRQDDIGDPEKLNEAFGSVQRASYNLFQSISSGISWGEIMDPLLELPVWWFYGSLFLAFIFITLFGFLNVLTSAFVESAVTSTAQNRETLMQQQEANKRIYAEHLRQIFMQIDEDGEGSLSMGEVERIFENDEMHRLLHALEIEAFDAHSLFKLLDYDGSGSVDVDEFCEGCLRLKGDAKAFDIQCLIFENQRLASSIKALAIRSDAYHRDNQQVMRTLSSLEVQMKIDDKIGSVIKGVERLHGSSQKLHAKVEAVVSSRSGTPRSGTPRSQRDAGSGFEDVCDQIDVGLAKSGDIEDGYENLIMPPSGSLAPRFLMDADGQFVSHGQVSTYPDGVYRL